MSLEMRLGKRGNLLTPGPDSYAQLLLKSPVSIDCCGAAMPVSMCEHISVVLNVR